MSKNSDPTRVWSIQDALETYGVPSWGQGYFGIGENGHVLVHPGKDPEQSIDLKALVDECGKVASAVGKELALR